MKRLAINYSRSFPSHFVPHDLKVYQELRLSPLQKFKLWKVSFAGDWINYWQIYLCTIGTLGLFVLSYLKSGDQMEDQYLLSAKMGRPTYKYAVFMNKKQLGRFDRVLNQFENEEGGLKDLQFV